LLAAFMRHATGDVALKHACREPACETTALWSSVPGLWHTLRWSLRYENLIIPASSACSPRGHFKCDLLCACPRRPADIHLATASVESQIWSYIIGNIHALAANLRPRRREPFASFGVGRRTVGRGQKRRVANEDTRYRHGYLLGCARAAQIYLFANGGVATVQRQQYHSGARANAQHGQLRPVLDQANGFTMELRKAYGQDGCPAEAFTRLNSTLALLVGRWNRAPLRAIRVGWAVAKV